MSGVNTITSTYFSIQKNRVNLALFVYFTKVSNQRNEIITNPNLVLLRILHRGVLGILDLLVSGKASVDEGVDEEADEEEDEGSQDGAEDEGHPHLTRIFNVMFSAAYSWYRHHIPSYTTMMIFWLKPGTRPARPCQKSQYQTRSPPTPAR